MERELWGSQEAEGGVAVDAAADPTTTDGQTADHDDGRHLSAVDDGDIVADFDLDLDLEEAWEHRTELVEVCRRILGDTALAEDVVQETYLQAVKNLHRLERRDGIMPWLVTVATRRSLNEIRRRKYSTPVEYLPEKVTPPEADPCAAVTLSDEFDRVNQIMETLTDRERDLLMRQVYGGASLAELAELEGSSAASVRSVLSRARSKIKTALSEAGARVLFPLGALGERLRRKFEPVAARMQQLDAVAPALSARTAEAAAAGVISLGLVLGGTGGAFTVSAGSEAPDQSPVESMPEVSAPTGDASLTPGAVTGGGGAVIRRAPTGESSTSEPDGGSSGGGLPGLPPVTAPQPGEMPDGPGGPGGPGPGGPQPPPNPGNSADEPEDTSGSEVQEAPNADLFFLGQAQGSCQIGCSTLFVSGDGGVTWTLLDGDGLNATSLLFPPDYPDDPRIFATGSSGLQVSENGGARFRPVAGMAHAGPAAISPDFSDGDPTIVVGSSPPWIWNAESGAARPFTGFPTAGHNVHFEYTTSGTGEPVLFAGTAEVVDGELVASVAVCHVQFGQDGCTDRVVLPDLDSVPRVASSSAFADDRTVFAWGSGGAYRSTDGGKTFDPIDIPFPRVAAVVDDGTGTFFAAGLGTDTEATTGGVARSIDGGETWALTGRGTPVAKGARSLVATGNGRLVAAPVHDAGGGIFCSSNDGTTWSARCTSAHRRAPRSTTTTSTSSTSSSSSTSTTTPSS